MIDFVTSDLHFGHENTIKHDNRPFANIDEMDRELIDRWNAKVKDRRRNVWVIGDFAYRNKKPILWYTSQLFGSIHLVCGNHDDETVKKAKAQFASVQDYAYMRQDGIKINLFHYACRTWRSAHHGSWLLFGHSHGRLPGYGRSMDVGCMNWNYEPLSFEPREAGICRGPM